MKKTFRFLALGFALICGTLSSWAGPRPAVGVGPADDTKVGATVSGGVVTYNVVGWDTSLDAYQVEITGLDYDGLNPKGGTPVTELSIKTSFEEKFGENKYKYYVTKIVDTDKTTKRAFWAMTQLKKLEFVADEAVISADKFTFKVGEYAFYGCDHMTELILPDNVNEIGKYAFQNTAITKFTIPAECWAIGENAFYNTTSLETVEVSAKGNKVMATIGPKVFANSAVSKLDLSKAEVLTMIADKAFIYDGSVVNNQLATIILPEPVAPATTSLFFLYDGIVGGDYEFGTGFANLTGLTEIGNLDKSIVLNIANGAFENCESLPILNFPATASITAGGSTSAFLNTPKLKTLTFADGWDGTIGSNIYLSTSGKKVVTENGVTKFKTWYLTPEDQAKELSYLENIEFKGAVAGGTIDPEAFGNNIDPKLACSGLKSVKFDGTIYEGTTIDSYAFQNCAALATLTFNGFWMSELSAPITIADFAFAGTAIEQVDFKGFKLNGDNSVAATIIINEGAFAADNLKKVIFGDIVWGKAWNSTTKKYEVDPTLATTFEIEKFAFVSDALTEVEFGKITSCNGQYDKFLISSAGNKPAFTSKNWLVAETATRRGALEKVKIGEITAGNFAIKTAAFASEKLAEVEIGNILTPAGIDGTLSIGAYAFGWNFDRGTTAQEKSVKIGKINAVHSSTVTTNTLTVSAGKYAFAGEKLNKVEIGAITDDYTTFTTDQATFGNTTLDTDEYEAMSETVTIGDLDKATVTFAGNAFDGPAKEGSDFTVTIGKMNPSAASVIASDAFTAPAIGSASYTLGDIVEPAGIAAGAFAGSVDEDFNTNTSVKIGNYNKVFPNTGTFTNVNDLTTEAWNTNSLMTKFAGIRELTVNGDVTKDINGGDINTLKEITLKGDNISGKIGNNTGGFGKAVRTIKFDNDDPKVIEGAIVKGAFANASDNAGNDETISVIYRVATAKNSNSIFNVEAFGTDDTYKNVVLYTDNWSKLNTFENVEIVGNPGHIYRMQLSASEVAPGEDIVANCITGANGKYAYGRLYVPAGPGMLYKVDAKYDEATKKNGVNLFYANISGTNIYMNTVRQMDGYYWIDATEVAQTLIVRTSEVGAAAGDAVEVTAEDVTQEEKDELAADGIVMAKDWFSVTWADMNDLRFATQEIPNSELQNNTEFKKKGIYVMANPKKNNLAFALLDQYKKDPKRNMSKGSVYVVTRADQYEARLNVIWPEGDEESEATAIQSVKNVESNDAIYNLQGVRLNKAQKGINIINGKKVIK